MVFYLIPLYKPLSSHTTAGVWAGVWQIHQTQWHGNFCAVWVKHYQSAYTRHYDYSRHFSTSVDAFSAGPIHRLWFKSTTCCCCLLTAVLSHRRVLILLNTTEQCESLWARWFRTYWLKINPSFEPSHRRLAKPWENVVAEVRTFLFSFLTFEVLNIFL